MPLAPKTKLGPYEIISPLGSGGMGEVYRARDSRLGRDVALKVLPEAFAEDADRLHRFEQEARTIATLNHPNILGLHDIGTHEGRPYLVSELLEGETFRDQLERGPIPAKRVIEYAQEIAHGLAAAHNKGIVHRDLKPENIFITRDGRVKILDFGLAKLIRPEDVVESAPTVTSPLTVPGMVMGTIGYMSPEQVKGEPSDGRSDIFSFGAVLFEMLTGKRAFKRDTAAETMTAILREEPQDLTETGWHGPLGLQKILNRCLEKNPERRFQSASDLGFAIEALSGTSTGSGTQALPAVAGKRLWWPWAAAAAALALVAAASWFVGESSITKREPKFTRLTYDQGYLSNARFAKDAGSILYSARWNDDPDLHMYSVRADFPQSTKVDLPPSNLLALAANGEAELSMDLALHSNFMSGIMAVAPMMGGTPRVQLKDVISADYAPNGKTLALSRLVQDKVDLEFPQGKVIYSTSGYLDYIRFSPDGKSIAFAEHPVYDDDRGWVSVIDESGKHIQLTPEYASVQGLVWSKTSKEIFYTAADSTTDRFIRAVSLSGKVRPVLTAPLSVRVLDIAPDGRLLVSSEETRAEIGGIDPATGKERKGLAWFDGTSVTDIRPDGTAFLGFEWGGPAGPLYMVIYRKLDGSAPIHLGDGGLSKLSPDGNTAAAIVLTRPPYVALYPIGPGEARKVTLGDLISLLFIAWFPDGKHLLLVGARAGEGLRSYQIDLAGGKPQPVGLPGFYGVAVSPDGKRIAGHNDAGEEVIFDLDTQQPRKVPGLLADTGHGIGGATVGETWADDGQGIIVARSSMFGGQIYRIDVATGKQSLLQKFELADKAGTLYNVHFVYAQKSKTYLYRVNRILSKLYVVEGLE